MPSCSDKSHTHTLLDLSNLRSEFPGVIFLIEFIWSAHVKHMGCNENYVTAKILMTGFKNPEFSYILPSFASAAAANSGKDAFQFLQHKRLSGNVYGI